MEATPERTPPLDDTATQGGLRLTARTADGGDVPFAEAAQAVWAGQARAGDFEVTGHRTNLSDEPYLTRRGAERVHPSTTVHVSVDTEEG